MKLNPKPKFKGHIVGQYADIKQTVSRKEKAGAGVAAFITQSNPQPILRITAAGKILYSNTKGLDLIENLSLEDRGLQLYRLGVLAQKSLLNRLSMKFQYNINQADYRIEVCPSVAEGHVDMFFTEISESVKIKNYFEVQSAFAEALLISETAEEVAWSIAKQAIARLGYEDCVVYLISANGQDIVQTAAHGPKNPRESDLQNPIVLKVGHGIAGSVALNKKAEIVNDVSKDPRYVVDDEARLSEIAVPILDGDELLGVIDSEHPHRNFYTEEDLRLLSSIASMAATKIQRIRSTEAIAAAQQKTKSLIENAFGGIYTLRGSRFEMVNRVFKEITGYSEWELTAPDFDMKTLIYSVEEAGRRAMDERAGGDKTPKSYQIEVRTKHGEMKRLAVNTVILDDERGPYTLGVALDISPLIESERTLKAVNEELSSRNEELRQFAHLASHNLRAPVSNMLGLLSIYQPSSDTHNEQVVESLKLAVHSLNTTLEDMHNVLKMRANETHDFEHISFEQKLVKAKGHLSNELADSGIGLTTDFQVADISYVGYHIDNFFLNLMSNAIKYRTRKEKPTLHIASRKVTAGIQLIFTDNGIGIDLERHGNEIFGMYKQFHNHPDSRGIGLYLVHSQLAALGGNIDVKSAVGKGSTFTLTLKTKELIVPGNK